MADRPDDRTGGPQLHGMIRLGSLRIALPAAAIREVIPCPAQLEPFVSPRREVIGAVEVRGQLVPVLDLDAVLGTGRGTGTENAMAQQPERQGDGARIVAILRHDGSVFGVLATSIEGVFNLDDTACHPLAIAGDLDGAIVVASFASDSGAGLVIDPAALATLPGLPLSHERASQPGRTRSRGQTADGPGDEPILIFTVGGLRCAVPTACVDASIPERTLSPAPVPDALWIGLIPHKGAEIPIIDTLALLDQGQVHGHRSRAGAVVLRCDVRPGDPRKGQGLVALLIDSVDDIVRAGPGMVAALSRPVGAAPLVAGLIDVGFGPCLMLDAKGLAADPRLVTLGGVEQRAEGASVSDTLSSSSSPAPGSGAAAEREAFLVYEMGGCTYATALAGVEEILPAGHDQVRLATRGLNGLLPWRGGAVPLLAFGDTSPTPDGDSQFVIIARHEAAGEIHRAGFCVDALRAVERKPRQILGHAGRTGRTSTLLDVTIGLDDGQACSVVDLGQQAYARLQPPARHV